jgi:hypothetical protein
MLGSPWPVTNSGPSTIRGQRKAHRALTCCTDSILEPSSEQAHVPAEQSPSCEDPRFPAAHAHSCRPGHPCRPPPEGPSGPFGLTPPGTPDFPCFRPRTVCDSAPTLPPPCGTVGVLVGHSSSSTSRRPIQRRLRLISDKRGPDSWSRAQSAAPSAAIRFVVDFAIFLRPESTCSRPALVSSSGRCPLPRQQHQPSWPSISTRHWHAASGVHHERPYPRANIPAAPEQLGCRAGACRRHRGLSAVDQPVPGSALPFLPQL